LALHCGTDHNEVCIQFYDLGLDAQVVIAFVEYPQPAADYREYSGLPFLADFDLSAYQFVFSELTISVRAHVTLLSCGCGLSPFLHKFKYLDDRLYEDKDDDRYLGWLHRSSSF
jgi:hypothetical protein